MWPFLPLFPLHALISIPVKHLVSHWKYESTHKTTLIHTNKGNAENPQISYIHLWHLLRCGHAWRRLTFQVVKYW